MTLKEEIEEIEFPNQEGLSYRSEIKVSRLLALFERMCLEVVGEDESYTDNPLATDPYEEGKIALRADQRQTLKQLIEGKE